MEKITDLFSVLDIEWFGLQNIYIYVTLKLKDGIFCHKSGRTECTDLKFKESLVFFNSETEEYLQKRL
jgi:hypothetical protein